MAVRTIDWVDGAIELIDQTALPGTSTTIRATDLDTLVDAISRLAVRGAPALGVAGAFGVALLARLYPGDEARIRSGAERLRAARPTAVNLAWGVDRALAVVGNGAEAVLTEAERIRDDDITACRSQGLYGADLVRSLVARPAVRVMTICNTGSLAAVERGTAFGVALTLFEQGVLEQLIACETRPLLQGARLTTWEAAREGMPYRLIADSAGPFLLTRGHADVVLIGADRIAANGDTANKIGSYSLALGARAAGVPFVVVAPESTVDVATATGAGIEIEDRGTDEVVRFRGERTAAAGTEALNPAFDVTPHALITAIVTDRRVVRFDQDGSLEGTPLGPRRTS